jgi:hypothetical protein
MQPAKLYQPKSHRALDENFTGTLPDKLFLDVLMKVNFSLPKTQLMQIAASCTDADVGGGRSFAPGSTRVNYNLFLRRVEAVLKVGNRSHCTQSHAHVLHAVTRSLAGKPARRQRHPAFWRPRRSCKRDHRGGQRCRCAAKGDAGETLPRAVDYRRARRGSSVAAAAASGAWLPAGSR